MRSVTLKKKILLVEDDPITSALEKDILESLGYDISLAPTGELAIDIVLNGSSLFDLILIDIDLGPGIDGPGAAKEILAQKDIPILFLSSHTESEVVEKTEVITSYGYVVKNSPSTVLDASIKMAFKLFDEKQRVKEHQQKLEEANAELEKSKVMLINQQEKLRVSENRFRTFVENSDHIVYSTDTNGLYTYVSPNWKTSIGESPYRVIGRSCKYYIHPDDQHICTTYHEAIVESGKRQESNEYRMQHGNGEWRWHVSSGAPIFDENEKIIGLIGVTRDITPKIEDTEKIKFQSDLLDQIKDAVVVTDLDGKITYVNEAEAKLLGLPKEKIIGQDIVKIGDNAKRSHSRKEITDTARENGYWRGEIINNITPDRQIVFDSRVSLIKDSDGNPTGLLGISTDITQRKLDEKALRESEEKNRTILDNAQEGICVLQDRKIVYINNAIFNFSGFNSREEFMDNFMSVIHPDDRDLAWENYNRRMNGEYIESYDIRIFYKQNEFRWFSLNGTKIRWNNKDADLVFLKDIDDRKRSENNLEDTKEKLGKILDVMDIGLIIHKPGFEIAWVNNKIKELFPGAEPTGKVCYEFFENRKEQCSDCAVVECFNSGEISVKINHNESHDRWFHSIAQPFEVVNGKVTKVLESVIDITERKLSENKLKKALNVNENLLRELQHRVKNSFMLIVGMIELMLTRQNNSETKKALNDIESKIFALSQMYELLYQQNIVSDIVLGEYVAKLFSSLEKTNPEVEFIINYDNFTIPVKKVVPVGIIISELATNSLKYAFRNADKGIIVTDARINEEMVTLHYSDNGPGLPEDIKIDKSDTLGLTLIKELTRQIKGKVSFYSEDGFHCVIEFPRM
jgi:PAS domain S-box-containing protein